MAASSSLLAARPLPGVCSLAYITLRFSIQGYHSGRTDIRKEIRPISYPIVLLFPLDSAFLYATNRSSFRVEALRRSTRTPSCLVCSLYSSFSISTHYVFFFNLVPALVVTRKKIVFLRIYKYYIFIPFFFFNRARVDYIFPSAVPTL